MAFEIGNKLRQGLKPTNAFNNERIPWNKGIKTGIVPPNVFKVGQFADEKHPQWKGDNVGYFGIHKWIERKLGKPNKCEFCGKVKGVFQWASKSREYTRKLDDWIRLCVSCHHKYDDSRKKMWQTIKARIREEVIQELVAEGRLI